MKEGTNFESIRFIRKIIKESNLEKKKIEMEMLLSHNFISEESKNNFSLGLKESIEAFPLFPAMIDSLSYMYNQKATIIYTKEKYILCTQNFVKGLQLRSLLVYNNSHLMTLLILYANLAFNLHRIKRYKDAILFINRALILSEQFKDDDTDVINILKKYSIMLFFSRGITLVSENEDLKKEENIKRAYVCLQTELYYFLGDCLLKIGRKEEYEYACSTARKLIAKLEKEQKIQNMQKLKINNLKRKRKRSLSVCNSNNKERSLSSRKFNLKKPSSQMKLIEDHDIQIKHDMSHISWKTTETLKTTNTVLELESLTKNDILLKKKA